MNKKLLEYIYNQRWCNFKDDIKSNKVKNITLEMAPFNDKKIYFILAKAEIKGKDDKYFIMPLIKGTLKDELPLSYKGMKVYDALKNNKYWSSLMETISLSNSFTISKDYKLIYQSWDNFNFVTNHINDSSRPLGAEQSNTTLSIGNNDIAFKQQRIIEFSTLTNPEVEMNYNLMKVNCPVVAKTYGHLFLLSSNGETAFVGIVQEFLSNKGDLWEIFTNKLRDLLTSNYKLNNEKIEYKDYKPLKKIIKDLGKKTSILLKSLSSFTDDKDLIPEPITSKYIKEYRDNLTIRLQETKLAIKKNIDSLPLFIKDKTKELLNNWDDYINKFISSNFIKIERRKNKGTLMRVHGDFHLGQAILTNNDEIKFIDFSGEPNLPFIKRKAKNPNMYDVASMYRSIDGYLKASVINKFARLTNGEIDKDKIIWGYKMLNPIIMELKNTFLKCQKLDKQWFNLEILRRNLYEVNYEISYRPQMLLVPISNLLNLLDIK